MFIETKVWISDYGYDETLHAFDKSAGKLGVDQIDLLILHQALPGDFDRTLAAYRAWRRCWPTARSARSASATSWSTTCRACSTRPTVVPAVNQLEIHPYFQQREVQDFDAEHGILNQAWSPIGGITFYRDSGHASALEDPVITSDRRGARQVSGPGDAALGSPARPLRHPEVDQARRDRREPRRPRR